MSMTAEEKTGALRNGVFNMFLDFLHCSLVDQRTLENSRFKAVTDFKFLDCSDEFLGKSFINARLDIETIGANTSLTGIAVLGNDRTFDCCIQVCIVEDDEWGISA